MKKTSYLLTISIAVLFVLGDLYSMVATIDYVYLKQMAKSYPSGFGPANVIRPALTILFLVLFILGRSWGYWCYFLTGFVSAGMNYWVYGDILKSIALGLFGPLIMFFISNVGGSESFWNSRIQKKGKRPQQGDGD